MPSELLPTFRSRGIATRLPDGSFTFIPQSAKRSCAILLHQLPHGRLSIGVDDEIYLTMRIARNECPNPILTLVREAQALERFDAPSTGVKRNFGINVKFTSN